MKRRRDIMSYKRILTVQDISCVGQCSLTVALPIISACGVEASVLPSAVLSTHTAGFEGYTFRDLTEDMPMIKKHWVSEGIQFDAIYTGYLGSSKQIDYVQELFEEVSKDACIKIVDPAMADNGKLYPGFDMEFVERMKKLCAQADYIIPNVTEACLLAGTEYRENHDSIYIQDLIKKLELIGCNNIIFTGVSYSAANTGVVVVENGKIAYYEHQKLSNGCHGTGDIYSSAFVGALMRGKKPYEAARIAADYTVLCIKETQKLDNHWYGAAFEPVLGKLIEAINK